MRNFLNYSAKLTIMLNLVTAIVVAMMAVMPAYAAKPTTTDDQFIKTRNINLIKSLYMTSLDNNNPEYYSIWQMYITSDFAKVLHDDVMTFSEVDFSCTSGNPLLIDWGFVQSIDEVSFLALSDHLVVALMDVLKHYALYHQYDQVKITFALKDSDIEYYPRIEEIYHDYLKDGQLADETHAEKASIRRCINSQQASLMDEQ